MSDMPNGDNPYASPAARLGCSDKTPPDLEFDERLDRQRERWAKWCVFIAVCIALIAFAPVVFADNLPISRGPSASVFLILLAVSVLMLLLGPIVCFNVGRENV